MTIGATIEARFSSTRLPGKVLMDVVPGWNLIDIVVARAKRSKRLEVIVVATSTNPADDAIAAHCLAKGYPCFRGSEDDVLKRVIGAAQQFGIETLVRLTGDNPLIDGEVIDDLIAWRVESHMEYVATTMMGHSENWDAARTVPRGISMEVLETRMLEETDKLTDLRPLEREAATFSIYDRPGRYKLGAFVAEGKHAGLAHPELRLTVDTPEDMTLAQHIFSELGPNDPAAFATQEAVALVAREEDLKAINAHVQHKVASQILKQQTP